MAALHSPMKNPQRCAAEGWFRMGQALLLISYQANIALIRIIDKAVSIVIINIEGFSIIRSSHLVMEPIVVYWQVNAIAIGASNNISSTV